MPAPTPLPQHAILHGTAIETWDIRLTRPPGAAFFTSIPNLILLSALVAALFLVARARRRGAPPASPGRMAQALVAAAILWGVSVTAYALAAGQRGALEKIDVLAWELSLFSLVVAGISGGRSPAKRTGRARDLLAILAGFTVIATVFLASNPPRLHAEEVAMGIWTRNCDEGRMPELFATGYFDNPILHFSIDAALLHLLPDDLFGLRSSSVLVGLLAILLTYRLGEEILGGRLLPALGALFVATHHVFLYYSRNGLHIIDPTLSASAAAYLALRAVRGGGWPLALLSGAAAGVGVQGYFPNRICAVIGCGLLLVVLPWPEGVTRRDVTLCLLAFAAAFLIALGPLPYYFLTHAGTISSREKDALVVNPLRLLLLDGAAWARAWNNAGRTLFIHGLGPDDDPHYGLDAPFLHPLLMPLVILGLGRALFTVRRSSSRLLLLWTSATLVMGSLLLAEPRIRRTLALIPVYGLLFAAGAGLLSARSRRIGTAIAVALLSVAAILQVDGVLRRFPRYKPVDLPSAVGRYLAEHPSDAVMLMTLPDIDRKNRYVELLAPTSRARNVAWSGDLGPGVVLVSAQHAGLLRDLSETPGTKVTFPFGPWTSAPQTDRLLGDSETRYVPPALVELDRNLPPASVRGGRVVLLSHDGRIVRETESPLLFFDFRREDNSGLDRVILRTRVTMERSGTLRVTPLSRTSPGELTIDGGAARSGEVSLAEGAHLIEAAWKVPGSRDSYRLSLEGTGFVYADPGPAVQAP